MSTADVPAAALAAVQSAGALAGLSQTEETRNSHKRKLECLDNMAKIEKEFADLRAKLFDERLKFLETEKATILAGKHDEFIDQKKRLEQLTERKIKAASSWRDYQIKNISQGFEAECQAAAVECEEALKELQTRLLNTVEQKKDRLIEERESNAFLDDGNPRKRRKNDRPVIYDQQERTLKRRLMPQTVQTTLKTADVLEDLKAIAEATGESLPKSHDSRQDGDVATADIYCEHGFLYYNDEVFVQGDHVAFEDRRNSGRRMHGSIESLSPSEVIIRLKDGSFSIHVGHLQDGQVLLHRR